MQPRPGESPFKLPALDLRFPESRQYVARLVSDETGCSQHKALRFIEHHPIRLWRIAGAMQLIRHLARAYADSRE